MTKSKTLWLSAVAIVLVVAVAAGIILVRNHHDKEQDDAVAVTVPLGLEAKDVSKKTKIGVVLTLGDNASQGSEWNRAVQGARVAQKRFDLGGTEFELVTENDNGTKEGARRAMDRLSDEGVSGVVLASSGDHLSGALDSASEHHLPVIQPYATVDGSRKNVWSLAPSADAAGAALSKGLGDHHKTMLVDAGGGAPVGVNVTDTVRYAAGDDLGKTAQRVAGSTNPKDQGRATADSVVISGDAVAQAKLVKALQAAKVTVPIALTGDATSPDFAKTLKDQDASISGNLMTVGTDADDSAALRSDGHGRAMSAFLNGVRVTSDDSSVKNLTEDQAFSTVADSADSRSHDAVVAFVRAVSDAGSTDPQDVGRALAKLTLQPSDGLAGSRLDFGAGHNASADAIAPLHASTQQLGLRPGDSGDSSLTWFAGSGS